MNRVARIRPAFAPALLWLVMAAAGCGNGNKAPADMCTTTACTGICSSDSDCAAGTYCDTVTTKTCVACVADSNCPSGELCRTEAHVCVPACSSAHGCGDAGVCETDAGQCVACVVDTDCTSAANPRCNPSTSTCVPCLPTADNCGTALYCAQVAGAYQCVAGCKSDNDCTGGSDAGSETDDGGADDGGVSTARNLCDTTTHQCSQCLLDSDCALGKLCKAGSCGDGCTVDHGCPGAQTCCGSACADLQHDPGHCGACGTTCTGGFNCCGGACSDPTGDVANCGACGAACAVVNGSAACNRGSCAVGFCQPNFADCNGSFADGCETETDNNVNNCGACNFVCTLPHALSKCSGGACQVGTCVAPYVHCSGKASDGCEVNSSIDAANCGGCGKACSTSNVPVPLCTAGNCTGACAAGYSDCNGDKLSDGCEIHSDVDALNCGGCGIVCSSANGSPSCVGGKCNISCGKGFANCSGDPRTGCETALNTLNNCGACGTVCALAHAVADCTSGTCKIGVCEAGWADCDGNPANGCEDQVATDSSNCGVCKNSCAGQNGAPACNGGLCSIVCAAGFANCDGNNGNGCETQVATDPSNCGVCNSACSSNHVTATHCSAGTCDGACVAGFADCNANKRFDGCETSTNTDVNNCGACGTLCALPHATSQCTLGACAVARCDTGWTDCNGNAADGCETQTSNDVNNCGACSRACSANNDIPTCASGTCQLQCGAGFLDCDGNLADGCEASVLTDARNCGGCNLVCSTNHVPAPTCGNGTCNGACAIGYADCDANERSNGCETNTTSDVNNCGGCGALCAPAHASGACINSGCTIAMCEAGWSDCDGNPANGCEVHTSVDVSHCGSCVHACPANNGAPFCAGGSCGITCTAGFAHCTANANDGCETDLSNSAANCGSCGHACNLAHATSTCAVGACAITACEAGYTDCDGNPTNGCETNTAADIANCGACNNHCSQNHDTATCSNNTCTITCVGGYADCNANINDGCEVALTTDAANCGSCGAACSSSHITTPTCSGGSCDGLCDSGFADCDGNKRVDGCEVAVSSDTANCGGCNVVCSQNHVQNGSCQSGACAGTCTAGWGDCDGNLQLDGCETNTGTNLNDCGGCGLVCSQNHISPSCQGGACTGACHTGYSDCNADLQVDGCETHTASDVANCGGCGAACSGQNTSSSTCVAGACNEVCSVGFADCNNNARADGCETHIYTDVSNCGSCGAVCSTNNVIAACDGGTCDGACSANFADCDGNKQVDGCETDTGNDPNNCGGCGTVCIGTNVNNSACSGGACSGTCAANFADCDNNLQTDGCETEIDNNVNDCGSCHTACSTNNKASTSCAGGLCQGLCSPGFGDCDGNLQTDGCETDTDNDPNACGGCGNICVIANGAPQCIGGQCAVGSCNAPFIDCNGLAADGCETDLLTDPNNCGACNDVCVGGATCVNGGCVPPATDDGGEDGGSDGGDDGGP